MTIKMLPIMVLLTLCFQAGASDYYKPLPYKMTYSEEMDWRNSHPGGWDKNPPPTPAELGLTLPSVMTYDPEKDFKAMTIYLVVAWLVWPFTSLLLLACGGKTAKMIGLAMLIPWLWFSMNRYMEFFCVWCVLPAWIIGALIKNIKKTVVG